MSAPASGRALLSDENIVPAEAVISPYQARAKFFPQVQGGLMFGAGIRNRSPVAARKASKARNGDVVVARLDGEMTLERLLRDNGHLALLPDAPHHE